MSESRELGIPGDPVVHDVLAAEEFALPAPDPGAGPVVLPGDPSGIAEPHDVLAAEAFALPASPPHPGGSGARSSPGATVPALAILGLFGLMIMLVRWRRRAGRRG